MTTGCLFHLIPSVTLLLLSGCAMAPVEQNVPEQAEAAATEPYFADIEVIRSDGSPRGTISGHVFDDTNRDGRRQSGETAVPGVLVSNGLDIVRTDASGAYRLPVRADMSVFVIQPSGWRTPTNAAWVPQFAYEHKPGGSPKRLRYGGLAPTGPAPGTINFPLIRAPQQPDTSCLIIGDSQTYNNSELGYLRDSLVADIVTSGVQRDCAIYVGDVVGDDLDLLPRLQALGAAMQTPQYFVHGNHDFDFDADSDADSADSWRRLAAPAYYTFEIGDALDVALDNVVYPCNEEDAERPGREFCVTGGRKAYNGRVTDTQMTWLKRLVEMTPPDRRIVLLHHIPFASFVDQTSTQHQTDNLADIHQLIADRPAISFSGHTHTIEVFRPGDHFSGWSGAVGVGALPFPHVIAGATSGGWWNGDFGYDGVPMSLGRLGEPRGYVVFTVSGETYDLDFVPLGPARDSEVSLSLNTPGFRDWFDKIVAWRAEPADTRDPVPPLSINDLPDVKLLTPGDLAGGVWLTANVWAGATGTEVTAALNGGQPVAMQRTQTARGDAPLIGAEYSDPWAAMRQLSVARTALQSRSGNARAQGLVGGSRVATGPRPPQPTGSVADRSPRLWRLALPTDLQPGVYLAEVTVRDAGKVTLQSLVFEVALERPQPDWRDTRWDAFQNGPPVR